MHVAIILFDGFDELDAVGPYRVFEGAATAGADVTVSLVTVEPAETVTASHGLQVVPDGTLDSATPDLVVVPGGGWNDRDEQGAWAEAERGDIPDRLARLHEAGIPIASVCTGAMLLERAGLLDGRPAATHHGARADLAATDAIVRDDRVVDDGDILTAGGVTSGIDLALHVVEREFSADIAETVAAELEYEPQAPIAET